MRSCGVDSSRAEAEDAGCRMVWRNFAEAAMAASRMDRKRAAVVEGPDNLTIKSLISAQPADRAAPPARLSVRVGGLNFSERCEPVHTFARASWLKTLFTVDRPSRSARNRLAVARSAHLEIWNASYLVVGIPRGQGRASCELRGDLPAVRVRRAGAPRIGGWRLAGKGASPDRKATTKRVRQTVARRDPSRRVNSRARCGTRAPHPRSVR
jgi:hypothetical protein